MENGIYIFSKIYIIFTLQENVLKRVLENVLTFLEGLKTKNTDNDYEVSLLTSPFLFGRMLKFVMFHMKSCFSDMKNLSKWVMNSSVVSIGEDLIWVGLKFGIPYKHTTIKKKKKNQVGHLYWELNNVLRQNQYVIFVWHPESW